ncbi:DUF1372 family protein [Streptococcus sp. Marseille-P7376]|uniref:DUF1372 family protein n=1 Tax=Streptococcus sp. Marseille-P7376 TaxID=2592044 RepID=UPI0011E6281E|nr:DUF1372 family protein [Streptococcus sp. Marseille-P7376]
MREHSIYIFSIVVLIAILLAAIIRINKLNERVEQLESRKLITIHRADNAGAEMHGRITGKEVIDGRYTVTAGPYGKFLVTEEQYEALEVGDEIPDYLRATGR